MKECIRCWATEKEIRKSKITCYVWWWSYKRHDYSEPIEYNCTCKIPQKWNCKGCMENIKLFAKKELWNMKDLETLWK